MADSARKLVEEVLSPGVTREIWSGNYHKALPVSIAEFELSAVLPAVFYMFRFGQRRGGGNFLRSRLKTPVSILSAKKKAQIQARLTL